MNEKLFLLIFFVAAGALLSGLSVPLLLGKIRPNPIYGFRVPKTFSDPEIWYAVNRYSARRLLVAGLTMVVAPVLLYPVPGLSLDGYAYACLGVFLVVFAVGLVQSFLYLRSL
jgi:uncharacterized membrane protein